MKCLFIVEFSQLTFNYFIGYIKEYYIIKILLVYIECCIYSTEKFRNKLLIVCKNL